MIGVAANTDLPFNFVVIRCQVRILDRPIGPGAFEAIAFEITRPLPPGDRVPNSMPPTPVRSYRSATPGTETGILRFEHGMCVLKPGECRCVAHLPSQ
jgi:hypothetical protein